MIRYKTMDDIPGTPFLRKVTILSSMGIMMDGYTLTVFSYALLYLINVMSLKSYEISIMGVSSISGVLIGSFIAGIGIGADYPVSSSIQAEFSPKKSRGKYLFFNIFAFSIGSLIFLFISVPLVLGYDLR